uniref:Uncharacterized protein n=1 Tax=Rhizophora mucronata TaxID=61149 RepID=A0A2P2P6J2_RHIMU
MHGYITKHICLQVHKWTFLTLLKQRLDGENLN